METILYPALTLALWGVGLWLLLRDVETHGLGEGTEPARAKRTALLYAAVLLLLTEGAAAMYLTVYRRLGLWVAVKRLALLCVLWPIALTDLKTMRIPNAFILLGLALRLILIPFELLFGEPAFWQTLVQELIAAGALLLASFLCALIIKNSIGFGDMKMFLVMGLLLGTQGVWAAVFLSLLICFFAAVFLLISKRKSRKDAIPFGPALVLGTYLAAYLTGM